MSPEPPPLGRYRRWLLGLLVIVWLSAFVATHIPPASIPRAGVGDWVLHTLGYFVLGSLFLATAAAYGLSARRRALLVLVLLAAYGAMDEVTQELVSRHASVWDWASDVLGVLLAVAAWHVTAVALKAFQRPT